MRPTKNSRQKRGIPQDVAGADTREQLLDAAAALFAEHGISATTVAKIAAHVGVTSAMIHYYFKTRDQLLDAVVEERVLRFIAQVWDPVTEDEDDPVALITDLIDRIVSSAESMPWLPPLWIREIVNEGGLLRERVFRHLPFAKLQQLAMCIKSAQMKGGVNPELEPRLVFISILGLIMMPLAMARSWNRLPNMEGVSKEVLARHATSLILHGLVTPAPESAAKKG